MAHVHDGEGELPTTIGRTFAIGIALNVGFVILEGLHGWRAGSLALLADAFHNLSDVGGLLLAWAGLAAARLAANDRHTYGWRRGSILTSFANAVLLLVAMGSLAWEAMHRLWRPTVIDGMTVIVVAAAALEPSPPTGSAVGDARHASLAKQQTVPSTVASRRSSPAVTAGDVTAVPRSIRLRSCPVVVSIS